jgi:hypothetical protein
MFKIQVPVFHDILDYLHHDRYLEPSTSLSSGTNSSGLEPKQYSAISSNVQHLSGENTVKPKAFIVPEDKLPSATPNSFSPENPLPIEYKPHTGPLLRPKMCVV